MALVAQLHDSLTQLFNVRGIFGYSNAITHLTNLATDGRQSAGTSDADKAGDGRRFGERLWLLAVTVGCDCWRQYRREPRSTLPDLKCFEMLFTREENLLIVRKAAKFAVYVEMMIKTFANHETATVTLPQAGTGCKRSALCPTQYTRDEHSELARRRVCLLFWCSCRTLRWAIWTHLP